MLRSIPAVLALALATGCVPKAEYNALEAALAETRLELEATETEAGQQAQQADLLAEVAAELRADKASLVDAVARLQAERAAAEQRLEDRELISTHLSALVDEGTLDVRIVDDRIVLDIGADILFPSGSAELSEDGMTTALQIGEVLDELTDEQVEVAGHTDARPIDTTRYPSNWSLGAARAESVMHMMHEAGLDTQRMNVASFAATHPVASNESAEGRQQNRRIEVVILPELDAVTVGVAAR